jgi:hypothetical protein
MFCICDTILSGVGCCCVLDGLARFTACSPLSWRYASRRCCLNGVGASAVLCAICVLIAGHVSAAPVREALKHQVLGWRCEQPRCCASATAVTAALVEAASRMWRRDNASLSTVCCMQSSLHVVLCIANGRVCGSLRLVASQPTASISRLPCSGAQCLRWLLLCVANCRHGRMIKHAYSAVLHAFERTMQ